MYQAALKKEWAELPEDDEIKIEFLEKELVDATRYAAEVTKKRRKGGKVGLLPNASKPKEQVVQEESQEPSQPPPKRKKLRALTANIFESMPLDTHTEPQLQRQQENVNPGMKNEEAFQTEDEEDILCYLDQIDYSGMNKVSISEVNLGTGKDADELESMAPALLSCTESQSVSAMLDSSAKDLKEENLSVKKLEKRAKRILMDAIVAKLNQEKPMQDKNDRTVEAKKQVYMMWTTMSDIEKQSRMKDAAEECKPGREMAENASKSRKKVG